MSIASPFCSSVNAAPLGAGVLPYVSGVETSVFTATNNAITLIDTTAGSFDINAPPNPVANDRFGLMMHSTSTTSFSIVSAIPVQRVLNLFAVTTDGSIAIRSGGALIWQYNSFQNEWLLPFYRPPDA